MTASKPRKKIISTEIAVFDGYVVCIGASAGGLDALERFFKACPNDTGAVYVVIQHLSPDHKSMMNNLLARYTEMPVIMVEDDMPIEANSVYLIPPGATMHIAEGHLHLTPKNRRGLTLPIDIFFSSLAEGYGNRSVGIILSGTGTDGTRGAVAINAAGGFLMAQDPETAKFDGMPRSAIATGIIDAILLAEDLPARLVAHINKLPVKALPQPEPKVIINAKLTSAEVMTAILQQLHQVSGIDFTDYKPATILRRIERRMQVRHTPLMHQYLDLLENDRSEVLTLRRELLISVTSFFRDPEAFETLYEKVISPMVAEAGAGTTLRAWTAGVATGEEAYTLAMLFIEAFERHRRWPNLKIFATDLDQQCIETASVGQYPESAAAELSPERLERFFVKKGDYFDVKNELRQCIVFARHNLLADPPFTKMDLVVCRNTLIYFKSSAQERALRALQYAVKEGGALMLGSSESLSAISDGMRVINPKQKLFRRHGPASMPFMDRKGTLTYQRPATSVLGKSHTRRRHDLSQSVADLGIAALLNRYAPPSMIVNETHEAVHLFGDISVYFRPREGAASLEVSRLLPEPLVPVASALLYKSERDHEYLMSDLVAVSLVNGERRQVRIAVQPLQVGSEERLSLLSFHAEAPKEVAHTESIDVDAETMARVNSLERELAATRESLQATIEELETSNEELQATNEELMASNEELQSSNEELQSVNEEMSTVNAEFQEKTLILNRINADLDSMSKAAGVATVFVDAQLMITRFSPDAMQLFKLRESDIGRRLDDIQHVLNYPDLMLDLEQTLQSDRMIEREIETADGHQIYLTRILPYLIPSSTVRGAVATFVNVSALHDAKRLQTIIDALPEHIAVLNPMGTIVLINAAWRRFAMANGDRDLSHSGIGINYLDVCRAANHHDDLIGQEALKGIKGVLEGTLASYSLEYPCHSPVEQRWFVMNVAPIRNHEYGAVISHVNISTWYQSETHGQKTSQSH
ncbi:MAG: hypothetical protein RL563_383 [Pseudomonadota bacterium]